MVALYTTSLNKYDILSRTDKESGFMYVYEIFVLHIYEIFVFIYLLYIYTYTSILIFSSRIFSWVLKQI